jgi:hypothetical protein
MMLEVSASDRDACCEYCNLDAVEGSKCVSLVSSVTQCVCEGLLLPNCSWWCSTSLTLVALPRLHAEVSLRAISSSLAICAMRGASRWCPSSFYLSAKVSPSRGCVGFAGPGRCGREAFLRPEVRALVCGDMVVAAAAWDMLVCVVVQCAGALCGAIEGGLPLCSRHMPKSSQASCAKTSAGVHPLPSHGNNKSTHGSIDYPRHGAVSYDAPLSPHVNS